jgi:Fic family protein
MILNNYRAMDFMKRHIEDDLAPSMIFELHHILMNNTVDPEDSDKVGRFREQTDDIAVVDNVTGESLHVPPPAVELPKRLKLLCDFANGKAGDKRLPELIRAIVVHFMIGYDHPFFDGNGRVARALFFWMVVKSGFWLLEYVSISSVIKSAPTSYVRAYMHVETDDNDVTYFIVHQLDVIKKAIDRLHKYLLRKTQEQQALRQALVMSGVVGHMNHRQLAVLHNAVEKPGAQYTVKSHKTSHGVAYETARSDLLALSDQYGLLQKVKDGRTSIFIAPADIGDRIRALKSRG